MLQPRDRAGRLARMMTSVAGLSALRIHLEMTSSSLPGLRSPQKMQVTIRWAFTTDRTYPGRGASRRRGDDADRLRPERKPTRSPDRSSRVGYGASRTCRCECISMCGTQVESWYPDLLYQAPNRRLAPIKLQWPFTSEYDVPLLPYAFVYGACDPSDHSISRDPA